MAATTVRNSIKPSSKECLQLYQAWKANQKGPDTDFCKTYGINPGAFAQVIYAWRKAARAGLNPLTREALKPEEDFKETLELDREEGKEQDVSAFSPAQAFDRMRKKAAEVYQKALSGKKVTPATLAAAKDVLKSELGKDAERQETSELAQWPTLAIQALIVELLPKAGVPYNQCYRALDETAVETAGAVDVSDDPARSAPAASPAPPVADVQSVANEGPGGERSEP